VTSVAKSALRVEHRERQVQHRLLFRDVSRMTDRKTKRKWYVQRTRRLDFLGVLANETQRDRRQSFFLKDA
jgi:hypothetical protein